MGFIDLPNSEIVDNTENMHVLVSDGKDIKRAEFKNENMVTKDTYEGLETEDKTVIGAINEVNEKTANAGAGAKSWDDLEDKPFYEVDSRTIYLDEQKVDGFTNWDEGIYQCSANLSLTSLIEVGKNYTVNWDGVEYICELKETEGGLYFGFNPYGASGSTKEYPFGFWFQYKYENGKSCTNLLLYLYATSSESSHTASIYEDSMEIKKLDKKYLPDDINADWNTLKNKPFYVGDSTKLVKLYENKNYIASGRWTNASNKTGYYTTEGITLLENSEYKVVLDGESYICKPLLYQFDFKLIIGNPAFYSDNLEDNGLPFAVAEDSTDYEYAYIFLGDQSSHEIEISLVDYEIHKIDEKYLPDIIGKQGEVSTADVFNDYKNNTASGKHSHAEGTYTTASGYASHAEGCGTTASGDDSHAECYYTTASGYHSHAEGNGTTASGEDSHAEGSFTTASGYAQHVQGMYNIEDTEGKYAHIVGNGNWDQKSNAHTIDWEGNAWFSGQIFVGGTGQNDTNAVNIVELINQLKADVEALKS